MVSTLGTFCAHVDAYVCKAWLVDCCCLSVACRSWLSQLCIYYTFGLNMHAICDILWACGCTCLQSLVGGLLLPVCGLSKLYFQSVNLSHIRAETVCKLCTCCWRCDAHVCKALFVGCYCLSVVCQIWRLHCGIYERCVLTCLALCVHSVGMWMHKFAKLGWWIVVACLWLVKAGFLMYVYMVDFVRNCEQFVYILWA